MKGFNQGSDVFRHVTEGLIRPTGKPHLTEPGMTILGEEHHADDSELTAKLDNSGVLSPSNDKRHHFH